MLLQWACALAVFLAANGWMARRTRAAVPPETEAHRPPPSIP